MKSPSRLVALSILGLTASVRRFSRQAWSALSAVMALGSLLLFCSPGSAHAQVKWNPGHYLDARNTTPSQMDALIVQYGTSPYVKGVRLLLKWSTIETSKGVYNFALLDEYVEIAENRGKHLIIGVEERHPSNGSWAPAYLTTEGFVLKPPVTTGNHQAKLWLTPCADYFIALLEAIGSRYDQNPWFEGLVNSEGYVFEGTNDSGFNYELFAEAYKNIAVAVRAAMPNTLYFSGWSSQIKDYAPASSIINTGAGFFFSDVTPHKQTQMQWFGDQNGPAIQWPSLDRGDTTYVHEEDSMEELYNFKRNTMAISHIVWTPYDSWWTRNDGTLVMTNRWAAILSLIAADNGTMLHMGVPPNLGGGPSAPPAPAPLNASAISGTRIDLSWSDVAGETGYRIEWKTGAGSYALLTTKAAGSTSHSDTTVSAATTYTYRIRAEHTTNGNSAWTESSAITTPGGAIGSFTTQDIGGPGVGGSASFNSGVYTMNGGGWDIQGTADQFHFVHQAWSGDGRIIARVTAVENTDPWAKAGLMFRDDTTAGSRNANLVITPANGTQFLYRSTAGTWPTTVATIPGFSPPYWLRLERHGSTFTGYQSPDGLAWFLTGAASFTLNSAARLGLAVTSHNNADLNTSTFDNVSVASTPTWTATDVGSVGVAGSASANPSTGVFTVNGSGSNITWTADSFQFYHQAWTGDATIIAEVTDVENTNQYAKGGLMIRQDLTNNSPFAMVNLKPAAGASPGVEFTRRATPGGVGGHSSGSPTASVTAPRFLKLVRSGNTFTVYHSADAGAWTQIGVPETISMTGTVYVGLISCAVNNATLCTSTFESVFIRNTDASSPPPVPASLTATLAASPNNINQVNLSWGNVAGETGYQIERKKGASGTYAQIGTRSADVTTFNDTTGGSGTQYYYRVRSTGTFGDSGYSNEANATTVEVTSGRQGHWKLDETSGNAADSSGNSNTGTLTGGPTWTAAKIGNGLSFDGVDDRANAGSGTTLHNLAAMTITAWIKADTLGESGKGRILDKSTAVTPVNGWCLLVDGTNQLTFLVDYTTTDLHRTTATNAISAGASTWYHVALTWSGSATATNAKLYVNGVETTYASAANGSGTRVNDGSSSVSIGNDSTGARTFDGVLDDVRVYDRVITATELQAIYRAGL